jgi:acetyl esterase/lipase
MSRYQRYKQTAATYWAINRMAVRAGALALGRRIRRNPRQPHWSLRYAGVVEFMRMGTPNRGPLVAQQIRDPLDRVGALGRVAPVIRQAIAVDEWRGEWLAAPRTRTDRVILYLHGGGYVSGSLLTHRALMGHLSRHANARVLALDYRLAPEHPYPAAIEDAWAAYWWLLGQGYAADRIVVAGDSAGGGLTLALLLALRDAHVPLPAAAICFSPWVDLALTGASLHKNGATDYINTEILQATAQMYLDGRDPRNPLVSPLYGDLHGLPPLLIQVGSAELLYDDGRRLAQRARRAGVAVQFEAVPGMVHVWQFMYWIEPKARQAVQRAGRFARRCWGEERGTEHGKQQATRRPIWQPIRQRAWRLAPRRLLHRPAGE